MNALTLQQQNLQSPAQTTPFQPQTMPSVHAQLAAYRAKVQEITSGVQGTNAVEPTQNPWAPDEINPNTQNAEDRDHQAWLDKQPVSVQQSTRWSDEKHKNILRNLQSDPAVKEISEPLGEILDQLVSYKQQGVISHDQAIQHLSEAAPMIEEAIQKHHGSHSVTSGHSLVIDPDLHSTPEILNKVKASKGVR